MENWNPISDKEKELKEALLKLKNSTDSVILTPAQQKRDEAQEKRFILQGRSYFALKAYVITAKEFPTTDASFDNQIPPECFVELTKVDPDIHSQTRSGLVKMGSSCSEFHDKSLNRIIDAGTLAVTWSEKTLNLLKHTTGFNLYDQLMVLVDTKYRKPADRDQAWIDAYNAATSSLGKLIEEADNGKTEIEAIRTLLFKFRDTTKHEVLPLVHILVTKYETGPVTNPRSQNKPYLTYLNEDLAQLTKEMNDALKKANDSYDEWKTATEVIVGVGVSFGWVPVFGWVPLELAANHAKHLHNAWEKLWESYSALVKHNEAEAKLIKFVQLMVKQQDDILNKIDEALGAVAALNDMFREQSLCYSLMKDLLSSIHSTTTEADAVIRQVFIRSAIQDTIQNVTELQTAGKVFIKAINNDPDPVFNVTKPAA